MCHNQPLIDKIYDPNCVDVLEYTLDMIAGFSYYPETVSDFIYSMFPRCVSSGNFLV